MNFCMSRPLTVAQRPFDRDSTRLQTHFSARTNLRHDRAGLDDALYAKRLLHCQGSRPSWWLQRHDGKVSLGHHNEWHTRHARNRCNPAHFSPSLDAQGPGGGGWRVPERKAHGEAARDFGHGFEA
mmetsp:Transcript_31208/g.54187  ORF Transcript_31208/g.54187 Transcript_31208/m.54187 type:complete len:126 (-) Transcript_31208:814-1191(-)